MVTRSFYKIVNCKYREQTVTSKDLGRFCAGGHSRQDSWIRPLWVMRCWEQTVGGEMRVRGHMASVSPADDKRGVSSFWAKPSIYHRFNGRYSEKKEKQWISPDNWQNKKNDSMIWKGEVRCCECFLFLFKRIFIELEPEKKRKFDCCLQLHTSMTSDSVVSLQWARTEKIKWTSSTASRRDQSQWAFIDFINQRELI